MKRIISFILLSFIINGFCIAQKSIYKDLTCIETFKLIQEFKNDTNFVIIDFRPEKMYKAKHIENSICYDVFSDNIDDYLNTLNKEKVYLIYCAIGYRSSIALKKMKKLNFETVYHLYKGIREWDKQGFEVISTKK